MSAFIGLLGAVVGALAVITAGVVGQWWTNALDRRAAARLVFWEVVANLSSMSRLRVPLKFDLDEALRTQAWRQHMMVFARLRDDSLLGWLEGHYGYVAQFKEYAADPDEAHVIDGSFRRIALIEAEPHLKELGQMGRVNGEQLRRVLNGSLPAFKELADGYPDYRAD